MTSGQSREPGTRHTPENASDLVVTEVSQPEPLVGPVRPTGDVTEELTELVEADETRLGEVYRGLHRNMTADQIAADLGVATSNFVWNYSQTLKALLEGDLPVKPTVALATARKFRALLRRHRLSFATRQYLQTNLAELERRASDTAARVAETEEAQEHTEKAEARNEVGIYAYVLPHYLRYPFDEDTGRTLIKVGRSDSDVIQRFRAQTRTTALPEEPILLRIYRTDGRSNAEIESDFHRLLEAADHARSAARTAGREWFVTSTKFLDELARIMRLSVVVVNEATVDDG
jgi:hypothetical protein